jgi:hypothetical protein
MRYSLVALTLAALTSHAWAEDEYTAKSLFFSESDAVVAVGTSQKPSGDNAAVASAQGASDASVSATSSGKVIKVAHKKKQVAQLGVSYFIRLKDSDGSTQDVLARRVFKSGERFQLGVKVNRPAYVYILNEAPDGTVTQIYPQPAQDNFVDAMGVVFFPAKGSFVFDSKPGMEKLMVFLSPEQEHGDITQRIRHVAPDLVSNPVPLTTADAGAAAPVATTAAAAPASDAGAPLQLASASNDYAAKGIAFAPEQTGACAATAAQDANLGYAAKGIVFSDDATPAAGGQVASYVVKQTTKAQSNLYLKINLAHE